jgi:hypothetical protein
VTRLGRAVAHAAIRLYPAAWRQRYGDEVHALVDDGDSRLSDAVDIARAAGAELVNGGHPIRFEPGHRHPGPFAALAALLLLPTLAFVALSIIGHELGVSAVAAAVDPVLVWVDGARIVDLFLVAAPLASLLIAVLPMVELRLERDEVAPAMAIRVRLLRSNAVVGVAALAVGAVLVAHIVTESVMRIGA